MSFSEPHKDMQRASGPRGPQERFVVAGIGELLWDIFPEGKRLGGAPVNFSYHCHQLGADGFPVSAVGGDELGTEILNALAERHLPGGCIAIDGARSTGTVRVTVDDSGKPSYLICEGVAWDHIPMSHALDALAGKVDAVCFGSLAQRNPVSRATIQSFVEATRSEALRIFDINLRQAFFIRETLETSLKLCTILKLNDEELPVLAGMFGLSGSMGKQLEQLRERFCLQLVACTRGSKGSLLITAEACSDHAGCPVNVVDSVGAGDAFTAALCVGLLKGTPLERINDHANRVGAFVCGQAGATPVLPVDLRSAE